MKAAIRDPQALRSIKPDDVQQYLTNHGWAAGDYPNGKAVVFNRQIDGTDFELLVPLSQDLRDFPERISEVLRTLEVVEKRDQIQILSDLTSARADVVRIRRPGAEDGTILLEDGVSLIQSALDMILAAACTTIAPRRYYSGKRPTAATDYLHKTRLGQSERGSYIVTVISPVPQRTTVELLPGLNDPFERQVTRMLSAALDATVQASERALRNGNTETFRESVEAGVSANLVDAILGLMGPHYQAVDVNLSWSSQHPINFESRPKEIDPDFAPVLEEASRFLKKTAEQPPVDLVGVVIGLRRQEGADIGRATLLAFIDGSTRMIGVDLAQDNYDAAILAHRLHRTIVCRGVLVRIGRASILRNMTGFEILPEPEGGPEEPRLF